MQWIELLILFASGGISIWLVDWLFGFVADLLANLPIVLG